MCSLEGLASAGGRVSSLLVLVRRSSWWRSLRCGASSRQVFGLLMFVAGLYDLIRGIRSLSQNESQPRRRKQRPFEEEDE